MASMWVLDRVRFPQKIEIPHSREAEYTIGRGKENFIKCLSLYVSRKHCKIVQRYGNLSIIDLSSANGTFVNKCRILTDREIPLQNGDFIGLGISEVIDKDCFLFQLHQNIEQVQHPPLPDSSTAEYDLVTIDDSDGGVQTGNILVENREALGKEVCLKRSAEIQYIIKPKIPRLEDDPTRTTSVSVQMCSSYYDTNSSVKLGVGSSEQVSGSSTDNCVKGMVTKMCDSNNSSVHKDHKESEKSACDLNRTATVSKSKLVSYELSCDEISSDSDVELLGKEDCNVRKKHKSVMKDSTRDMTSAKQDCVHNVVEHNVLSCEEISSGSDSELLARKEEVTETASRVMPLNVNNPVDTKIDSLAINTSRNLKSAAVGNETSDEVKVDEECKFRRSGNKDSKEDKYSSEAEKCMNSFENNVKNVSFHNSENKEEDECSVNPAVHKDSSAVSEDVNSSKSVDSKLNTTTVEVGSEDKKCENSSINVIRVTEDGVIVEQPEKKLIIKCEEHSSNKDLVPKEDSETKIDETKKFSSISSDNIPSCSEVSKFQANIILTNENETGKSSLIDSESNSTLPKNILRLTGSSIDFIDLDDYDSKEDDDVVLAERLKRVLYSDHKKNTNKAPSIKFSDKDCILGNIKEVGKRSDISKNYLEPPAEKGEPLMEEEVFDTDVFKKGHNKFRRIISTSSSSSTTSSSIEGDELQKKSITNKQKLVSEEVRSDTNFRSHKPERKRKLSTTSESSRSSVGSEGRGKIENVDADNLVKKELLATVLKNKPVVKLERLSDVVKNVSNDSQPDGESSMNYTLEEDIIVISDDEDEYFPSSQIFDDQKPAQIPSEEIAVDDTSFSRVPEDEDTSGFGDSDSDLEEDHWFKRLSQQDSEPELVLPPQKDSHSETKCVSAEEILNATDFSHVSGEDKIQKEILHADKVVSSIAKDDRVKGEEKPPLFTLKSSKSMLIDAPPMPPRRASMRGISVKEAERIYKERNEQIQQPAKQTNIVSTDNKSTKHHVPVKRRQRGRDELVNLSAKEKKQIADQRKERLKAISEKEKAAAALSKKQSTKVPAEAKIKFTDKNRGAFLIEGAEQKKNSNKPETSSVNKLQINKDAIPKIIQEKELSHPKKRDSRSASAPIKSVKDLPRIPKIPQQTFTKSADLEMLNKTCSDFEVTNVLTDRHTPEKANTVLSRSCLKSYTIPNSNVKKIKKRVHFKDDRELVQIQMIPVAEDSRLLPVAHKKDAPTPKKISTTDSQPKGPELEDALYDILCWNPKWLEEQKNRPVDEPPPVHGDKLWPMLSSFVSYKDYLKVLTPLLLLEMWTNITKENENSLTDPRKAPVVVGIDHIVDEPFLTPNNKQLMHIQCHAILTEHQSQKQNHPHLGDLVYLELELQSEEAPQNDHLMNSQTSSKQRRIVPIFAYVKRLNKEVVTGRTEVHKEILRHSGKPECKLTLLLMTKYRKYDVKSSQAMRIKVVSYIRHELRLFQALAYLPSSPLCNHVLMPETQNFSLPDVKNQGFVPVIKTELLNEHQKRAILQTAQTCLKSEPRICMIQGPPGTGKSHVIVNLIMQILYEHKQNRKSGNRRNAPRILVCAPSNAAIDELVIRLLRIRHKIPKEDRFKMVRTGRQETMNPLVKDISVMELAKRDARNIAQSLEGVESVELEIRNLEARKNSLLMALDSARQKDLRSAHEVEFKLGEVEKKLLQMRKSKTQNLSMDPRELWRLERDAQSRILLGAEIVATTLSSCFNGQMEFIFTQNNSRERSSGLFTCCIVDEATQSRELETLIPLMLGVSTLVLVGDAKQLPATVLSKVAKDHGLGKSLFGRLQECFEDSVKNPVQFLGIQYRMHPDILHWPNRFFYNGRLHSAQNLAQQRQSPLVPYCILSLEYKQSENRELSNAGEAELVSQLILGILEKVGNKLSIGIITPYHKQRTMILAILQSSSNLTQSVEVNTIDSFQGQERDIIVMSCVRTGGVGFLSETQRLNVALTRARHSLLLCGNFSSLKSDSMWRALLENANQRNVLKHVPSSTARNKDELMKLVLRDK